MIVTEKGVDCKTILIKHDSYRNALRTPAQKLYLEELKKMEEKKILVLRKNHSHTRY